MQLTGEIFKYNNKNSICFVNKIFNKSIIFIGGLGDNILSVPYIEKLNNFCLENSISLYIPQLRSHPNYFIRKIDDDVEDLRNLIKYINSEDIVLLGHSTGCQDALLTIEHVKVKGVILQAPVSDVESNNIPENLIETAMNNKYILHKNKMYLSERFLSLYKKFGKDDLFSSYLPDENYSKFKDLTKIIAVISEKDEFYNKPDLSKFKLMGDVVVLKDADHSITNDLIQSSFIEKIREFLAGINYL